MTPEVVSEGRVSGLAGSPSVLAFNGRLADGPENAKRYQELCAELERGSRDFVLDLQRVPDLDSMGIGFLIMCLTTARRAGGSLCLAAPSNRVLYSLLITRLDTIIPIFDSVEAAVAGLSKMSLTTLQERP